MAATSTSTPSLRGSSTTRAVYASLAEGLAVPRRVGRDDPREDLGTARGSRRHAVAAVLQGRSTGSRAQTILVDGGMDRAAMNAGEPMSLVNDSRHVLRPVRRRHQRRPVPAYARLREEAPVYHNDRYDFWALSRHDDVEQGARQLADVLQHPQRHPRRHQGRRRAAARRDPVRGPAAAHDAPRADVAGVHARAGWRRSRTRSASSASAASTRSSARAGSTSSPSSPPSCRCG